MIKLHEGRRCCWSGTTGGGGKKGRDGRKIKLGYASGDELCRVILRRERRGGVKIIKMQNVSFRERDSEPKLVRE